MAGVQVDLYEQVDQDRLRLFRRRRERWVMFDDEYMYKFYAPGWEFADMAEKGVELGYYDEVLMPHFVSLLQDKAGRNRGYVMKRIAANRVLSMILSSRFSIEALSHVRRGRYPLLDIWHRPHGLSPAMFVSFLKAVLGRAVETGWIFTEISPANVWIGQNGYHIFDLDALRAVEWMFPDSMEVAEYRRKIANQEDFNVQLAALCQEHELVFPEPIITAKKLRTWWPMFCEVNKL